MRESTIILKYLKEGEDKGRIEGLKEGQKEGQKEGIQAMKQTVISLGTRVWGVPSVEVRDRIDQINDLTVLQSLSARVLDVKSWAELLA